MHNIRPESLNVPPPPRYSIASRESIEATLDCIIRRRFGDDARWESLSPSQRLAVIDEHMGYAFTGFFPVDRKALGKSQLRVFLDDQKRRRRERRKEMLCKVGRVVSDTLICAIFLWGVLWAVITVLVLGFGWDGSVPFID